jgi:uncharacterized protein (UPF0335 family)
VLKTDWAYIHTNSSFLFQFITKVEKTVNVLSDIMKGMKDIQGKLNKINGSEVKAVKQKLRPRFSKNKGFKVMCEILCASEEEDIVDSEDLNNLSTDFVYYKYARLLS